MEETEKKPGGIEDLGEEDEEFNSFHVQSIPIAFRRAKTP